MTKYLNEGSRLLDVAMKSQRLSQADVEQRCKLGGGMTSRYLAGERLPDRVRAIALRDAFEIPIEAWDEKPAPRRRLSKSRGAPIRTAGKDNSSARSS
jgi:transcriptional regulator with XRE-family HTH domain